MAVRRDLRLLEANAETVREAVTDDDSDDGALDLAGKVIEFLIKPNDITADSSPSVVTLSTATGEITVTDAAAGICEVAVPPQIPGQYWRRLDVITGSDRKTAVYGPMHVISV